MAIPDYEACMLPLLKYLEDGKEHAFKDSVNSLADFFSLTADERSEFLPSGTSLKFASRVGWAKTYLSKAGLIKLTRRAHVQLTERGIKVLQQKNCVVNKKFLMQYQEFVAFQQKKRDPASQNGQQKTSDDFNLSQTPTEALYSAYEQLRSELISEIIDQLQISEPAFFERNVIEVLVKMGYGGSLKDAGAVIGRSGDEGIDGVIKEDILGLDNIYVQAKRWEGSVGRPEIQKFVGALHGQRARKGIFITLSDFTRDAFDYVKNIESKVVLINGQQLAEYMIDYNVGVTTSTTYSVKKLDSDYFNPE
jgi:restriction system protein